MRAWRAAEVPYEWVGYYLPSAPCHKGTSWGGKRQTLTDMGWGVAVVYVGQQPWGEVSVPVAARAAVAPPKPKPASNTTSKVVARVTPKRPASKTKAAAKSSAKSTAKPAAKAPAKAPAKQAAKSRSEPAAANKKSTTCDRALVTAAQGTREADDAVAKAMAE